MSEKEKNRKNMPLCTAFIDEMREYFPDLQVTYARENGIELGQSPERGCSDFVLQSEIDSSSVKPDRKGVKRG